MTEWLSNFILENRDPANGWRRWVLPVFVVLATVILLALLSYKQYYNARKLNVLARERDLALEAQKAAIAAAKLERLEAAREELLQQARDAEVRARAVQEARDQILREREKNEAIINSIHSWEDVDSRVK